MKHFKIIEIISMRKVQIGVIVILLICVFIHLLMTKAYPFADLFSSFGGFSVPHNSELNPIIKENHISALKTEEKVPQVEKLSGEKMEKVFEWHESRAKPKAHHPSAHLKAAFMCDDVEIPILVIDGNESAFIRRSNDNSNEFNWKNYPKVSNIEVNTRHGDKATLEDVFAQISRSQPSNGPLNYRPVASLVQGGQNVNEPPGTSMVEPVDNNLLALNENNDEQLTTHTPCTSNLCNGQQIIDRSNFPIFNVQFLQ